MQQIKRHILVTGGAGYIGSHVCKVLDERGMHPIVVDNLSTGDRRAAKWGTFVEADIKDKSALRRIFNAWNVDAVIHMAADSDVGASFNFSKEYYENNVGGTINLIEVIEESGLQIPVVYSSSCSVYGYPREVPIRENHGRLPASPYGRTKLWAEENLFSAYLPVISLRYFNVAGSHKDADIGDYHIPSRHIIPRAISAAIGKLDPFFVYGTDYSTHDGTAIRDYIHVCDVADVHYNALFKLFHEGRSRVYNIGSGIGYTVLEVIKKVEEVTGNSVPYAPALRLKGNPDKLIANNTRARRELGLSVGGSSLKNMIQTTYDWMMNRE